MTKVFYTISSGDRGYQIEAWDNDNMQNRAVIKGFRGRNISGEKVFNELVPHFGSKIKIAKIS